MPRAHNRLKLFSNFSGRSLVLGEKVNGRCTLKSPSGYCQGIFFAHLPWEEQAMAVA